MNIDKRNLLLWGKLADGEYPAASHPVACHIMDVCAVAEEIWSSGLSNGFRRWLAEGFKMTEEEAGHWIPFCIGLHDIGKVSPAFQRKSPVACETLAGTGLPFPRKPCPEHPHGLISTVVLPEIWETLFGLPIGFGRKLADAVGGHHGLFADSGDLGFCQDNEKQLGDAEWHGARVAIVEMMCRAAGVGRRSVWPTATRDSTAWFIAIAGLTSVADWIGSMANFFPPVGADIEWNDYVIRARAQARSAIRSLGWDGWQPPNVGLPLSQLFPFIKKGSERPLQVAVAGLTEHLKEPSLVLIEAPMGEGKTEAAMLLADHFAAACQQRGCYFALPTMATSNQMFGRIQEFLSRRYPIDRVNLLLLHGRASLSEALRELLQNAKDWQPSNVGDEQKAIRQNLTASEWFTYRKRGLLAPFGVGTIDQVLLSVLQTKHVFVRLFGLAHKTIIIDEVHAYDAYMTKLLELLLTWLRSLGASVILLSATLPRSRRSELLAAWQLSGSAESTREIGESIASPEEPQYPRISWIEKNEIHALHVSATSRKPIELTWKSGNITQLGNDLRDVLCDGGCAAVICNTVSKAQRVYIELKNYFGSDEIDLFHARYPVEQREEREKRALALFGKPNEDGNNPPNVIRSRRVLVATQVVEQSLDIDFDLMVTEISPVDLMLQRAGRLHRHERVRPARLALPALWVLKPEAEDVTAVGVPVLPAWGGSRYVYEPHILWRTWLRLRDLVRIRLPEDIEPLIDLVYDDNRQCPDELPDAWKDCWNTTREEMLLRRHKHETEAVQRLIKGPAYSGALNALTKSSLEDDEEQLHPALRAVTRLGPPSVSVVCLYESAEGDRLAPFGRIIRINADPISGKVPHDVIEELVRRSVSIADWKIVNELLARSRVPKEWEKTSLLRNQHLLRFDTEGRVNDPQLEIVLDPELGLRFRRMEESEINSLP